MKVITKTIHSISQSSAGNKKHLIYFFGLGESIKVNNELNDWGKWVSNKNIDIHLFDYHYTNSLYPEHFHNTRFRLKQTLITIIATSIVGFTGYSIIASKMSIWLKLPVFMVFLTSAIVVVGIMAFYSWVTSFIKFATKGKDPVKAGMAIAVDLLEKGVHPDNIILMGNSLGGGVAAEVLEKFEEEKIHFTFIHSNSYDSWKNVLRSQKSFVGTLSKRISVIVDIWFKLCNLNHKPNEIIKSTEAPVLATNSIAFGAPSLFFSLLLYAPIALLLLNTQWAAIRNAFAARLITLRVPVPTIFPPVILLAGLNPSQEEKCFSVGHLL